MVNKVASFAGILLWNIESLEVLVVAYDIHEPAFLFMHKKAPTTQLISLGLDKGTKEPFLNMQPQWDSPSPHQSASPSDNKEMFTNSPRNIQAVYATVRKAAKTVH